MGAHHLVNSLRQAAALAPSSLSPEWRGFRDFRANVLVRTRTPRLLIRAFMASARQPIEIIRGWTRPTIASGTLIVREVEALGAAEQRQLLDWLTRFRDVQCVSLVRKPLFPMVAAGRFLAELYYRLNTVYVAEACVWEAA